jgi:DNA-binding CsgD family transcriptional regulator
MIAHVPRPGASTPLVARRTEMWTLREAWRQVRSGQHRVVLLSGDAGVGKSRLLAELTETARSDGGVVVTGRCLDTSAAALPYLPFAEAVGQLTALDPSQADNPALRRLLGGQPGDDHLLGQYQLFDAVHGILGVHSAAQPLILAVEDLHWADRSSRDLFAFLASRLSTPGLLVVGTYRSDDLHRRHPLRPLLTELVRLPITERLHLNPFDRAEAREFVRSMCDGPWDEDTITRIAERSEGNAFMAEELVSASTAGMPPQLADVLLLRLERLSSQSQQVVRLASVFGKRFTHDRITATAALHAAELDTLLREAITHHVLVMDEATESYAFRHALLREAVYADLLPGERTRLHGRIAAALTAEADPCSAAELAHHSMESHDTTGALAASTVAAQQADELAAPAEALAHVERALQLWQGVAEPETVAGIDELSLTRWAARTAAASGEPDRAIAHSLSAIRITDTQGDVLRAAEARRHHVTYLLTQEGSEQRAYDIACEAWKLVADREPDAEKAWVQAVLVRAARDVVPRDELARLTAAAIATATAIPGDGPHVAAGADALISRVTMIDRRDASTTKVLERLSEAADAARRVGATEVELRARFQRGLTLLDAAHLTEASRELDSTLEFAVDSGHHWSGYGLEGRVLQVICRFMIGDWDGAEALSELAAECVSGTVRTRLFAAGMLVAVGRGRFEVADRWLPYLRDRWQLDLQVMTLVCLCGTELESWRGRPRQAVAFVTETLEWLRREAPWHMVAISLCAVGIAAYAELAVAARRAEDPGTEHEAIAGGEVLAVQAAEAIAHGTSLTRTMGAEGRAWSARVDAEVARLRGTDDVALWREVVAAFDYGEIYRQAHARWRLAETLLATGGDAARQEAAAELRQAAQVADRLDAKPLRESIDELSRRARLAAKNPAVAHLLTPRESAVLRLVAQGKTNKQVGVELFISEKTVSVHLSRVMAKLEVKSRTEAVSIAHTRGLLTTNS